MTKKADDNKISKYIFVYDGDGLFDIESIDMATDLSGGISVSIGKPSEQGSGLFCSNDKNCS